LANGTVIKGDVKYGAKRSNPDGSIALHAKKIEFEHPVSHFIIQVETEQAKINSTSFKIFNKNDSC
jgi:23S rRNA pseudouridine1911/1915/1917 synthase